MSSDTPLPDHLDRWTARISIYGDTKAEVIRKLVRLAEAIERDPDGYNNGCGGNGTTWIFTEDPEGLTGEARAQAVRDWMRRRREVRGA